MRISSIPLILTAMAGALALSGCDERPSPPPFTGKTAPASDAWPAAPETLAPPAQEAGCCACPSPAAPACPEVAPTQVAARPAAARPQAARQGPARTPQRSERAYAHGPARVRPAAYHPTPPQAVDYGYQALQPVGHHGGYVIQPAPEPVIRDGYAPPPQGYAHVGGGGPGPCCAGPSVQAAGRDSAGYLTWSGKRPPAPYY